MKPTKLVAFRCDAEVLEMIDAYCSSRSYLKRSSMINRILYVVLKCSSPGSLLNIVETWDAYSAGYEVTLLKRGAAQ